jgi:ribulose-phosphate 3-epimerase
LSGPGGRVRIAASILAADFGRLGQEARAAAQGGAALIHVDVMDGRFVPEITMGPGAVRALHRAAGLPVDVHLMIVEPERHLDAFAAAGAAAITVHVEVCPHLYDTVRRIAALGVRAGVAINPATPPEQVEWVLSQVAQVLVMTVEPGAGGQPFIPEMTAKVATLEARRRERDLEFDIAVDGGIGPETVGRVVEAGATVLVAGTALFGAKDGVGAAIARLKAAALRPAPSPDHG